MAGKGNTFENDILKLIFQAVAIANIADNASASPLTNLYVGLYTSDPGEAGTQETNETTYTGYARVAVARSAAGWTVTDNSVSPAASVDFGECSAGPVTITHIGVGTAASGAGKLLYSGTVTPNIAVIVGTIPRVKTTSTITED